MVNGSENIFAHRTNWRQESNALNEAFESLKKQGIEILDLTASNPTSCGFAYPQEFLEVLSSTQNLNYKPDALGMAHARQAVADYYASLKVHFSIDQIVLTASTSEAYSFLMRLLVNPGEKILTPRPSYPLFQFLLEINDVAFQQYPLHYEGQKWRLHREDLERLVDAKTKAIILVNPNNPTGSYISPVELNSLNEFCRKHQLAIISDEVFYEYALGQADSISCAGNQSVLTFTLGGLSKTLGLPQMKCGWILASCPKSEVTEAISRLEIIADTYLSVNTPVQNALGAWLSQSTKIQDQIKARVISNWQWLIGQPHAHTEILSLQGGWYATLRVPAVQSEESLVLQLLKEDKVLVYPGYFFDFDKEAYLIVSLLPPADVFQEAGSRIFERLAKI